ncbi:unnamed protein product [Mytilus coruscus]|uniref:Uncharacterized protein n=1 Tax=Mytilus coruscus TaxID=42192 RepID=A0A6J8ELW0_MYTCO|nr:unnamed protein product [Mytilus coruscus]
MDVTYVYVFLLTFFNVILEVSGQSVQEECPVTYHQCTGGTWCCPEGLYCTGTSLCLSINGMIVLAILSSVGLGILLAAVCVVYSKCTGRAILFRNDLLPLVNESVISWILGLILFFRREEARVSESYVQSDNSLTEKHKKKRKRPKYAKRDFPSDSSESESDDYSHRSKKSKATKHGRKSKKSSKKDDFSSDSESDKEVRSVISETVSNLTYSDKNGNKSYHRFNPHKKEKTGLQFSNDMELFLDDNFNRFIPSHKV